ncbi:MAG: HAMP domain-containing protein [Deltaproteobacteria bacterium]|nr:HAMP domain-containing protein [Deltaproteobacteria bacterium]
MALTHKIWLLVTIPFVVAIATYLIATRPFRRELLLAEARRDARDDVVVLQTAINRGLIDEKDKEDLAAMVDAIAHAERVIGVAVFAGEGALLAASPGARAEPLVADAAHRALAGRAEVSELRGEPTRLIHAFHLKGGRPEAVAVVVRDVGYIDKLVGSWTRSLLWVGLVFAAVMLLISAPLVSRIVGAPLGVVVRAVEEVAAGKLDVRVPDRRKDELGRLARSFNEMTESLRSARARVEEETATRANLEARMRRLQTLAAAGEVAASLAHEIGSPLNVILGRARMVAARPDSSEATKRDLEIVATQTERITRVVRKLLDISRPPKGRVEKVDVRAVVDETLAFVAPECKKRHIATTTDADAAAPTHVLADRDQIVQIVFNLVHNAIQAQPNGGRIDVRLAGGAAEVSGAPLVIIEVRDAGPGIDPELRGRVFDPFVTTKKAEGGTGLGLAIVDGMVRELGGRVVVDDAPGGGACFRVNIPAVPRDGGPPS